VLQRAAPSFRHFDQLLSPTLPAQRHDNTTVLGKLLDERLGDVRAARRGKDRIERSFARTPLGAVALENLDIAVAKAGHPLTRDLDELVLAFNRGLIDEDFFFENTGEQWVVWERLKPVVPAFRTMFKNPLAFSNLEKHCEIFERWREKRAPGSTEAMRAINAQMQQQAAQKKSGAGF